MSDRSTQRRVLAVLITMVVVVSLVPGVGAAQSGVGDSTVVERGESVSSISGVYGSIIIEGTVTGDVSGVAGNIVVRDGGVVEGDFEAAAGSIRIGGTVQGTVSTGAGSIYLTDSGVVEGNFDVGAGDVRIEGTIRGDAQIGAETIRLGEAAAIDGSLTYDGSLEGNRDAVSGDITRDRSLGGDIMTDIQPVATWIFAINAFILNLLLGVLLLGLFPNFSDGVADRVRSSPLRSGLVGIALVVGFPIVLILVAITIVGIPVSIAGLLAFLVFAWIGLVYGRFAVGVWLLSALGIGNRWGGLVVGLVLAAILGQIPLIGGVINLVIFLLGIGSLAISLVTRRRRIDRSSGPTATPAAAD